MSADTVSKVGRHRIYSNEQRKDRNRKAQAAFRNRRNEYTKNLEAALLEFENKVAGLKVSNTQLEERAKTAETRCAQLASEVNSLHKLLQLALSNNNTNHDIISPVVPIVPCMNDNMMPLSPIDSCSTLELSSTLDSETLDFSWLTTDASFLSAQDNTINNTWYTK